MKMAVFWSLAVLCADSSFATIGEVTGPIALVRSADASVGSNWFQMDVPSAGACALYNGLPIFFLKDDANGKRQFVMVVAATMAGKNVKVSYDDSALRVPNSNYCYVRFLDIY